MRCASACALAVAALAACHTTKVVNFAAPTAPCATEEDLQRLSDWLPTLPEQPTRAEVEREIEIGRIMDRLVTSVVYCQKGAEKLR